MTPPGLLPGKTAARELLASTLNLMTAPPVNLRIICDHLGIEVYAMPCTAFCAVLSPRRDGTWVMLVNSRLGPGRFRFSIAHELGHYLLRHRPVEHIDGERNPQQERQADVFAAELLLPEEYLRADLETRTLPELAERYRVSRQALSIRLKNLGL